MKLSKKYKCLNHKQYKSQLCDNGDQMLNSMNTGTQCPTVSDLISGLIVKFITLAADGCGYSGTAEKLIVNHGHPLIL